MLFNISIRLAASAQAPLIANIKGGLKASEARISLRP